MIHDPACSASNDVCEALLHMSLIKAGQALVLLGQLRLKEVS